MRRRSGWLLFLLLFAIPTPAAAGDYGDLRDEIEQWRQSVAQQYGFTDGEGDLSEAEALEVRTQLWARIEQLFDPWMGTPWTMNGLSQTPGEGSINCGGFVGTILVHAGFEIDHYKLQRQPAELIIESLSPSSRIRRFRNTPMAEFLEAVRQMGSGLYILGLDNHVGFIVVEADETVRFVHSTYVAPGAVVDEPAREAGPIVNSDYRVIGEILRGEMLEAWLAGRQIPVKGNW